MLSYPARIRQDGIGFAVSFPDVPEARTGARTRDEALGMAADALATAMDFYFEDLRPVPVPSAAKRGQLLVDLPTSVGAKVLLLNEKLHRQVTPAKFTRCMNARPQKVNSRSRGPR